MKLWWVAALGIVMATATTRASTPPAVQPVKDADGNSFGVLVVCNDCQSAAAGSKKGCDGGAEEGWLDGRPCGKCLLTANYAAQLQYPYDLHVTGKLTNDEGQPVKDRFVKLFMANGWTVRTKTSDQGMFRLTLGATQERKAKQPLVVDLGVRVDSVKGSDPHYAIFLLPESYKPCTPEAGPARAGKTDSKKQNGKKP